MSRKVIEDIVLPIILKQLREEGELPPRYHSPRIVIKDDRLLDFLESQLVRELGVIGEVGGRCEALEYILTDLQERCPEALEKLVNRILSLYVKLRVIEARALKLEREIPDNQLERWLRRG
jgi:hypothetical protein